MGKITEFEDLRCWQKARELVREVYALVGASDALRRDFRLRDQITSAAVSVMSNIAEGFGRYHKRDFIRFLDIASSSASEVKSLLYVVLDLGYVSAAATQRAQQTTDETKHLTLGLLRYLKNQLDVPSNKVQEAPVSYSTPQGPTSLQLPAAFLDQKTETPQHSNT